MKEDTYNLPKNPISKDFKEELQEWAHMLEIPESQVLEFAFDHYTANRKNFIHCKNCEKPIIAVRHITANGLLLHKCHLCGYDNEFDMLAGGEMVGE